MAGLDDLRCYDRLLYDFEMLCLLNGIVISKYPVSGDKNVGIAFLLVIGNTESFKHVRIPVLRENLWDSRSFIQYLLDDVLPKVCPDFDMGMQMI